MYEHNETKDNIIEIEVISTSKEENINLINNKYEEENINLIDNKYEEEDINYKYKEINTEELCHKICSYIIHKNKDISLFCNTKNLFLSFFNIIAIFIIILLIIIVCSFIYNNTFLDILPFLVLFMIILNCIIKKKRF
ncbi:MAG: hypothetical protein KIT69_06695 [Propionibacteriaceae bacterium]|nr:hypothetical protein [Propionibacteriaceae bacterium]